MKKILIAICMLAMVGPAFAQGSVNFLNYNTANGVNGRVRLDTLSGAYIGATYLGQIFAGSSAGSLAPIGSPVAFRNNTSGVGTGIISAGELAIPGIAAGSPAFIQLRAWEAAGGATWDAASVNPAARVGQSATITVTLGGGTLPPAYLAGLAEFAVVPVPEPSTIALGLLGVAMLAIRRRK